MPATAPPPQKFKLTNEQFLRETKPKSVKVCSATPYVDGGTVNIPLPQSGLLECLWIVVQGSVTWGGTVTSGTYKFLPYPAPFSIIKNLRLGSNNAFNMRDLTGWGWYKWIRYRYGICPITAFSGVPFSPNVTAYLGQTGTRVVAGANVAAGTFTFNFAMPLPIAYNRAGETGLLVLQQNSTFYNLSINFGQITGGLTVAGGSNDMVTSLVSGNSTLTFAATCNVTVGMDWFEVVPGIDDMIALFTSVSEVVGTPLIAGDNVVKLPVNDFYTTLHLEVINNGNPVAVANISNLQFMHSGNIYDYMDDMGINIARSFYLHDLTPMDSMITWDLGLRRGFMSRRDTIDAFNNMQITDAQLRFTLPGTLSITGTNQWTLLMESLRLVRQG